jgi:PKD repeat protein
MKNIYYHLLAILLLLPVVLIAQNVPESFNTLQEKAEFYGTSGIQQPEDSHGSTSGLNNAGHSLKEIPAEGIILVPNSGDNSIMALDPETGELIDAVFFPPDSENLSTPIEIIYNGMTYFISDQLKKLIQEFDTDGMFIGTFAPSGGEDETILSNIRGFHLRENGNILVTVAGGDNANSVAEFDTEGNYIGNFITNGAGGLDGPWDILHRPDFDDYLVSANGSAAIHRYDNEGNFIGMFATGLSFPEQMQLLGNGNILVANFSGASGLYEFDSEGNQVGYYNVVTALRGVHELPDGNILVTKNGGVYKVNRENQNLGLIASGNARFITLVKPMSTIIITLQDDFNIMINNSAFLGAELEVMGGEEPYSYLWSLLDSDWTSNEENPSFTFEEEGSFVFTLEVTDSEGETGTAQLNVFVYTELFADAGNDMYVQVNVPINLGGENLAEGGMPPFEYLWTLDGSDWSSNDQNPEVSMDEKGEYSFTLMVTDSEGNTAEDDMTLIVFDELEADAGDDQTVIPGEEFILGGDPTANEGIPPYSYNWNLAGSDWTSNEANPTTSLDAPGGYQFTVQVTDAIDNTAFSQVNISVLDDTAVDEIESEKIKLFPNPASDRIWIEFPEYINGDFVITDVSGRDILREKISAESFEVNIQNWPAGIYIIRIQGYEQKFMIQK